MYIIFDGTTTWREALLLTSMYFVYVLFVIALYLQQPEKREEKAVEMLVATSVPLHVAEDDTTDAAVIFVWNMGNILHRAAAIVDAPLQSAISAVIPSLHVIDRRSVSTEDEDIEEGGEISDEQRRNRRNSQMEEEMHLQAETDVSAVKVAVTFLCSVMSVGGCSIAVVYLSEVLVEALQLDRTTIGATVLALGSQLPDIVSSVALAKAGYFDGAMAGAIGSQVTSITLGVGMPGFIMCAYNNGHFHVDMSGGALWLLTSLLMMIVAGYAAFTLPLLRCMCSADTAVITRRGAYIQLGIWAASFVTYIVVNEFYQ